MYNLQSNPRSIAGGLATTDETQFVFQQPSYELEAFRATLIADRLALSWQVRDAVNLRNEIARNADFSSARFRR